MSAELISRKDSGSRQALPCAEAALAYAVFVFNVLLAATSPFATLMIISVVTGTRLNRCPPIAFDIAHTSAAAAQP